MFSHVVIFWTDPAHPNGPDELIAEINKYLRPIPGIVHFHCGKNAPSARPVVEKSYQVALNLVFTDRKAQDDYQAHPLHQQFLKGAFSKYCLRAVVYDFE